MDIFFFFFFFFFGGGGGGWGRGGGVITKLGYILGEISMHFRVFSEGQGTEWRIFLGCLKFKYLFGGLEILDIFFFWGGGEW